MSAGLLQAVGSQLVEIHGQHDGRALLDTATHRAALDAFGGFEAELAAVRTNHAMLTDADEAVAAQRAAVERAAEKEEYARHVVEELAALKPEAGEEEVLAARRQELMQLERAAEDVSEADELLSGSAAPGPALISLMRRLIRKVDGGATLFQPVVEALDATLVALDHTSEAIEALKRDMAFDPAELEQVEESALRHSRRGPQSIRSRPTTLRRSSPGIAPIWKCWRTGRPRWSVSRLPRRRRAPPMWPPPRG